MVASDSFCPSSCASSSLRRPRHNAAYVRQQSRVLRRDDFGMVTDNMLYLAACDGPQPGGIQGSQSFPPLSYGEKAAP